MKRLIIFVIAGLLFLAVTVSMAQDKPQEKPWFDMKNCDFCKNLMVDSMLLPNLVWEHHDISNGLMTVTIVKPEYKASYQTAMDAMNKLSQEMAQGKKDVKMCGSCQAYGGLMMAGAKVENVHGDWGDVALITSDKPEVQKMIKDYGQRTRDEMAKMMMGEEHHKH